MREKKNGPKKYWLKSQSRRLARLVARLRDERSLVGIENGSKESEWNSPVVYKKQIQKLLNLNTSGGDPVILSKEDRDRLKADFDKKRQIDPEQYVLETRETYVQTTKAKLEKEGFYVHVFDNASYEQVYASIKNHVVIEDIDVTERLLDKNFRFITPDKPEESLKLSEVMSAFAQSIKSIVVKKAADKSVETRSENADEFAKNIYNIIEKIKLDDQRKEIRTYRDIAAVLNNNNIETYNGKTWHPSTVRNISTRWKELGLIPDKSNKKNKPV